MHLKSLWKNSCTVDMRIPIIFLTAACLFCLGRTAVCAETSANQLFQKGEQAFSQNNYKEAVSFYQQVIKEDPNNARAYSRLGMAYGELGADLSEVVWYLKTAVSIDPNLVDVHEILCKAYYGLKEFDNAEKSCLQALALSPQRASVDFSLAWIYLLGKSRPAEAIPYFEKVIERKKIPRAYLGLGMAYFMNNQPEMVLEIITELRNMHQEDLALQLENMIRGNEYKQPLTEQSLIGISKPGSQKGVIVPGENISSKSEPPDSGIDIEGQVTKIRMRGKMINTGSPTQIEKKQ